MLGAAVVALIGAMFVADPPVGPLAGPLAGPMAGGVDAGPCKVRVASVESRVAPRTLSTPDPARVLFGDFTRSLDLIDCQRERIDRNYEVMAELVSAESASGRDQRVRATVTVKAIVKDGSGALLAVVHGKAKGEDRSSARASLERELLQAAAAQASSSVPEAIRRARGSAR